MSGLHSFSVRSGRYLSTFWVIYGNRYESSDKRRSGKKSPLPWKYPVQIILSHIKARMPFAGGYVLNIRFVTYPDAFEKVHGRWSGLNDNFLPDMQYLRVARIQNALF